MIYCSTNAYSGSKCCWYFSQAIVMALESKGDKTFNMVLQLLKSISASSVITVDQMRRVRHDPVFVLDFMHKTISM